MLHYMCGGTTLDGVKVQQLWQEDLISTNFGQPVKDWYEMSLDTE